MNRYLIDFSILLHDFFYRYPEYGSMRFPDTSYEEKLLAYRKGIHASLEILATKPDVQIATCSHFLLRLTSVMAEYHVTNTIICQELSYLLNNYHVISVPDNSIANQLQALIAKGNMDKEPDFDFLLIKNDATLLGISQFITTDPRFSSASTPEFQVLTPESIVK